MDKSKSTIDYLRMEPASNGVIISYTEKVKKEGSNKTYDDCSYLDRKEVFDTDGDEHDGIEKAFSRFKELWMRQYVEMMSGKMASYGRPEY